MTIIKIINVIKTQQGINHYGKGRTLVLFLGDKFIRFQVQFLPPWVKHFYLNLST